MRRSFRLPVPGLAPLLALLSLAGCTPVVGTDGSGTLYGLIRGTVTRTSGAVVPNAPVGASCVGASGEPFGLTTDTDAAGRFEFKVNALSYFAPLDGPSYVCRVLTPYTGVPQAEKSVSMRVGSSSTTRPLTEVSLVTP